MSLFGKKKIVGTIIDQTEKVNSLKREIEYLEIQRSDERAAHKKEIENLNLDHEIVLKRKDAELDVKIAEATAELKEKLAASVAEAGNYKKETEILTKAFENLGFDVKDMKEILNKLVDGIVSKNQIQLVK